MKLVPEDDRVKWDTIEYNLKVPPYSWITTKGCWHLAVSETEYIHKNKPSNPSRWWWLEYHTYCGQDIPKKPVEFETIPKNEKMKKICIRCLAFWYGLQYTPPKEIKRVRKPKPLNEKAWYDV